MKNNGWIKIHRKFLDWEWFKKPEMVKFFIYLLLSANHEDGTWRGQDIKRGQLITGLRSLAKKTGISIQTLRTLISTLKSTHELTIKSTHQFSIITIVKYEEYQKQEKNQHTNQHTNQQQINNKQEVKEDKKNTSKKEKSFLQGNQWNELIDPFREVNPMYLSFYKNKTERRALDELAKQITFEKLKATIEQLPKIIGQPYAPKVTTPRELQRDLGKLIAFVNQQKSQKFNNKQRNIV